MRKRRSQQRRRAYSLDSVITLNQQLMEMHPDQPQVTEAFIFQAENADRVVKVRNSVASTDQWPLEMTMEWSDKTVTTLSPMLIWVSWH